MEDKTMSNESREIRISEIQLKINQILCLNPEARDDFVKNIRWALEKHFKIETPPELNIHVLDMEDPSLIVFSLPKFQYSDVSQKIDESIITDNFDISSVSAGIMSQPLFITDSIDEINRKINSNNRWGGCTRR